ncbi:MAG: peptidyl-alpha-hydroxyglycine alpha-amidating lyase family protein [Vicinamibacterales bacterium]|nr:peptidyl-alpha-hydroxyglycine alpha-amidating lyase family protein [Vicinamibacterales bacterium]
MKNVLCIAVIGLIASIETATTRGQGSAPALPLVFRAVEKWAHWPEGRRWGTTDGVEVDSHGVVWVAERCGGATCEGSALPVVLAFDPSGRIVRTFGAGYFVSPHGVYVDRSDNIWVTDRGTQQVFRFRSDGTITMTLGTNGVKGSGPNTFNEPSDVVVAANGDIFVADGHGGDSNARIVKFSPEGVFLKTWGQKGQNPGEFDAPHSIAIDSRGRLFVVDRGNDRIQVFDQDGTYLDSWRQFGRPSGIYIDHTNLLYVTDSGATRRPNTGVRIASAETGAVLGFIPDPEQGTGGAESVAVDALGNIYRPEVNGRGLVKFVRQ